MSAPLLVSIGVDYRTAQLAHREALAFDGDAAREVLDRMLAAPGIREAAVVSTCSRTEFYVVAAEVGAARDAVTNAVETRRSAAGRHEDAKARGHDATERWSTTLTGHHAARHLLRVACAIDSPILGDAQILGQVKAAYAIARAARSAGPMLHRLFETALRAGKRARHETGIGQGSTSTAAVAAALVARGAAPLSTRRVVVVGAGEIASLVARHLAKLAPGALVVVNRTLARAEALARSVGGHAAAFPALQDALADADVVVSATSSPGAVISVEALGQVMRARPGRPLLALDLAVPRDIDWQAAAIPGVTLHAIDGVQAEVSRRVAARSAQVPRVEAIVREELRRFVEWQDAAVAARAIRALRGRAEQARLRALSTWRHASAAERTRADRATRLRVNRLLHEPMLRLKAMASTPEGVARLSVLQEALEAR